MLTLTFSLKAAGNAVKRASDNLVKAAQKAAFDKTEDDSVVVKTKFVGGIAQVRQNPEFFFLMRDPQQEILPVVWFALSAGCLRLSLMCPKCHGRLSEIVMSCCG